MCVPLPRAALCSARRFIDHPRGAFDLAPGESAATNAEARDGFGDTITGGDQADLSIAAAGDAAPNATFRGAEGSDAIPGTPERNLFRWSRAAATARSGPTER